MANMLTTNEGEVRERVTEEDERFLCANCDTVKPIADLSELTNLIGLCFCKACRDRLKRNPNEAPTEWRGRALQLDAPLDAPIAGITPAMIEAGAIMAAEVFRGKVTEGDARLWVGEIYAAMRAVAT